MAKKKNRKEKDERKRWYITEPRVKNEKKGVLLLDVHR